MSREEVYDKDLEIDALCSGEQLEDDHQRHY